MNVTLRPRESVIHAVDFPAAVAWYRDVLGFNVIRMFDDDYDYANLENDAGIRLGIANASQMNVEPADRSRNTVVLQFEVEDVGAFLDHVAANGGAKAFGPSFDSKGEFWYGGFTDFEGNPFWVVDRNCP